MNEYLPVHTCPTEQEVRDDLHSYISDAHKDAYGFRPRGIYDIQGMSIPQLEALCSELSDAVGETIDRERAEQDHCRTVFEKSVTTLMADCEIDRATAIRWLMEAEGEETTMSYFQFEYNLGYDYNILTGEVDPIRIAYST
jgi:hypothetical protein